MFLYLEILKLCGINFKQKIKLVITIFIIALTLVISSCSSDDDSSDPINPVASGFTWKENVPNSTTIQMAYTPIFSTQYNTLFANTQAGATLFEVNLSVTTIGSYPVDNSTNFVTYTGENPFFIATSGTVNITASANGKISGNFEAFRTGTAGSLIQIYATFIDVAIVP